MTEPTIDPQRFRQVLGHYPTGVCVIAAIGETGDDAGRAAGMAVGSFVSVSLDPPLVAFFPDKGSTSWPRIERAGKFCVNILAADQQPVCARFASRMPDKFDGLPYRMSPQGSPIIDGVAAWIDCTIHSIADAGDHLCVIGRVWALEAGGERPLIFHRGGYGGFELHPADVAAG